MDFAPSPRSAELRRRIDHFMDTQVFPVEHLYREQVHGGDAAARYHTPPVLQQLKAKARAEALHKEAARRQRELEQKKAQVEVQIEALQRKAAVLAEEIDILTGNEKARLETAVGNRAQLAGVRQTD